MTGTTSQPAAPRTGTTTQSVAADGRADSKTATTPLTLPELRAALPEECFVKSVPRSLWYLVRDGSIFVTLLATMYRVLQSQWWHTLSPVAAAALLMPYWMATGFIMWCMFVVGHDCGHGSFSDSTLLNAVCGHVMHAPLLVPFYAWADSHRQHHLYHNHFDRDMSFPWFFGIDTLAYRFVHAIRMSFPFTGYAIYLAGSPDGGHWLPFGGRLWANASLKRVLRSCLSSITVFLWAYFVATLSAFDWAFAFRIYGGAWLSFSFWLVTVTYLQHHDDHTIVYTAKDWNYLRGAFQTIDREYGAGIDNFHHNITDGHVVHHLFFTQIPHYHLTKATTALRQFLADRGLSHIYRFQRQHDFFFEVFRTLWVSSFLCRSPPKELADRDDKLFPLKKESQDRH